MKGLDHLIRAAVLEGFESYKQARSCIDSNFVTTKTTRSSLMHDAIIDQARLNFVDPQFKFIAAKGGRGGPCRTILVVDQSLGLQFKLAGAGNRPCNIKTAAQRALDHGGSFNVGWAGELPIQTVLYQLTKDRSEIRSIMIISHGRGGLSPFSIYDISREEQSDIFNPTQQNQSNENHGQEYPRKKRNLFRRPDEQSDGQSDAASA